jgi:hypothetical protein
MRYFVVLGGGGGGGGGRGTVVVVLVLVAVVAVVVVDTVELVVDELVVVELVVVLDAGSVVVVVDVGGLSVCANDAVCTPAPNASDACTFTMPAPAGTTTVALVAFAATTVAAVPPKVNVAFSRPMPLIVTCAPVVPDVVPSDVMFGHDQPPAIGEPTPLARSMPTAAVYFPECERVKSLSPVMTSFSAVV